MLAGGTLLFLADRHFERRDQSRPRLGGVDHVVDVQVLGGPVRVGELVTVFLDLFLEKFVGILGVGQFLSEDNWCRAFRVHHRQHR